MSREKAVGAGSRGTSWLSLEMEIRGKTPILRVFLVDDRLPLVNEIIIIVIFSGLLGFFFIIPTRMSRGIAADLEREKKVGEERAASPRARRATRRR